MIYFYFKTYNNELLCQAIAKRTEELGYKNELHRDWYQVAKAIIISDKSERLTYSSSLEFCIKEKECHEGVLDDLFNTNKYKVRSPIDIGGHDVVFHSDRVTIDGWFTLYQEDVETLIKEWEAR